jgi:hypothetical protein
MVRKSATSAVDNAFALVSARVKAAMPANFVDNPVSRR